MNRNITLSIIAVTTALSTATWANEQQMSMQNMRKSIALNHLHHTHQKEIKLSEMAMEKSQSPEVKQLAQTIIADHKQSDSRVMNLAKSEDVSLENFQLADYEKVSMDMMEKLTGAKFDQAYVNAMHMGHKEVMNHLQRASKMAKDPELKAEIDKTIPSVQKHMEMAGKQFKQMGGEKAVH